MWNRQKYTNINKQTHKRGGLLGVQYVSKSFRKSYGINSYLLLSLTIINSRLIFLVLKINNEIFQSFCTFICALTLKKIDVLLNQTVYLIIAWVLNICLHFICLIFRNIIRVNLIIFLNIRLFRLWTILKISIITSTG